MKLPSQFLTTFLTGAVLLSLMSGCRKDVQVTEVMLVNTAINGPAVDFYPGGSLSGQDIGYLESTGYQRIEKEEGEPWIAEIKLTGTDQAIYSASDPGWEEDGKYSLWLYGEGSSLNILQVTDNFTTPPVSKAMVRFFHFSPDAPQLDVGVSGGSNWFSGLEYIGNNINTGGTGFLEVEATTFNIELKMPGSSNVIFTQDNVQLQSGGVYTFYLRGLTAETGGNAFGLSQVRNR